MPRHKVSEPRRAFAKQMRSEQTALEEALWQQLRAKRLGGFKFRRQVPIEGYVADFVCFEARLIVEVDGPMHARLERQAHDAARDTALRRHGFRTLRFDGETVLGDLGRVLAAIEGALRSSPSPGRRPRPAATLPRQGGG